MQILFLRNFREGISLKKESVKKNLYRLFFVSVFLAAIIMGISFCIDKIIKKIPDNIYIEKNNKTTFAWNIPATCEISNKIANLKEPVTFYSNKPGSYKLKVKLFGIFDTRTVNVNVVDEKYVYPGGFPIGLYLKSDGILAVDTSEIKTNEGNCVNPCANIIKKGDYILSANGNEIKNKEELIECVNNSNGNRITFEIRRDNEKFDVSIQPVLDEDGKYKIGLWVKDDIQGIGTLTYISEDGKFAALGHGITDNQTEKLMDSNKGLLYKTKILSIVKGVNGKPGEYIGTIDYSSKNVLGDINKNTECGIYGTLDENLINEYKLEPMQVGYSNEVQNKSAYIRLYDENKNYNDYEIIIENINYGETKNITFKVTSSDLLNGTNGIIQGMSGAPIIQNGKIIGAVTHVLVNDSTRGYGIFIEKMIEQ